MLKRREMFSWLRGKNNSIYLLQEVHCCENTTPLWSAEWGYKSFFSCCTGAKAGVAILFNNTFDFEMQRKLFLIQNFSTTVAKPFLAGTFVKATYQSTFSALISMSMKH